MLGLVIETEISWFDYVSAGGTIVAVILAGYAAVVAQRSANAAVDLVGVESARDARDAEDGEWRQARRVALDLQVGRVMGSDPPRHSFELAVWNTAPEPILKARLKVTLGESTWGPQLVGTIGPGDRAVLTATLDGYIDDDVVDGLVYFKDVEHREWVASVRAPVRQATGELDQWIEDSRQWAEQIADADQHHRGHYVSVIHARLPNL